MSQATQSQTAPLTLGQHPPTAAMSEATRTQAAPPPSAAPGNTSEASLALNRARTLDQQGKEAECMEAVRHAKLLAGATLVQAQAQQTQPQQGQMAPTPSQAQDRLRSDRLPDRRGGAEPDYFESQDEILAHMETRLARFKEALHLTPDQEKNWPSFQSALRDVLKLRLQRTSDLRDQPPISPVERLRRDADQLGTIAASLKHLADAEEPLYNSLNDGQKERFARLARMARRHLASLAWQGRTDASAGDRSRYSRDERYGWQGRYGGDEDEGWRGRYRWRDHIMNDPDKGWRDHRGMAPRGRMMDDDEEDGAMMGRGRMRGEYDDRTDWRHRDRDGSFGSGGGRRYHGRGMMDGWRGRDCEPDRD
jgi:hypothetical protein